MSAIGVFQAALPILPITLGSVQKGRVVEM